MELFTMRRLLFFVLALTLFAQNAFASPPADKLVAGKIWGGLNGPYSILFRLNGSNIAGSTFHVVMPGQCTSDDGLYNNTFDFGGIGFPNLVVRSNGRFLKTIHNIAAGTGHVGTLVLNCAFVKIPHRQNAFSSATCVVSFDSPARGDEQLDSCTGGTTFARIRTGR